MSRLAWVAPACVVAAVVTGVLLGGPSFAGTPTPTPTPPPSSSPAPTQSLLPGPTPTAATAPVTQLRAAVDTTGALVVTWRAASGDRSYTATATAAGRTHRAEVHGTRTSFSGLPAGATVRIAVVAHGDGGDAAAVTINGTMPSGVPRVTGATMSAVATGMLVSWQPPAGAPVGARYLVELRGADGAARSRLVTGARVTVTGLTSGGVYTGSITTVTDTGRSAPASLGGIVWTPPAATDSGPVVAAPAAPSSRPSVTTVPHTASPALADAPTRRLVSSPVAAAALAGLAVVLGGVAIALLLRRPRAGTSPPGTRANPLVRSPHS